MDKPVKDAGRRRTPAHNWLCLSLGCDWRPTASQKPNQQQRSQFLRGSSAEDSGDTRSFLVVPPLPQQSALAAAGERDKCPSVSEIRRPISSGRNLHNA